MAFGAIKIEILNDNTKSWTYFDYYINFFLYHFFKTNWCLILLFYLNFDKKLKIYLKIVDYHLFFLNYINIKFYYNRFEVLEVLYLMLSFF